MIIVVAWIWDTYMVTVIISLFLYENTQEHRQEGMTLGWQNVFSEVISDDQPCQFGVVSDTQSPLKLEAEIVSEALDSNSISTQLIA
jgi:hypothetical protein